MRPSGHGVVMLKKNTVRCTRATKVYKKFEVGKYYYMVILKSFV